MFFEFVKLPSISNWFEPTAEASFLAPTIGRKDRLQFDMKHIAINRKDHEDDTMQQRVRGSGLPKNKESKGSSTSIIMVGIEEEVVKIRDPKRKQGVETLKNDVYSANSVRCSDDFLIVSKEQNHRFHLFSA